MPGRDPGISREMAGKGPGRTDARRLKIEGCIHDAAFEQHRRRDGAIVVKYRVYCIRDYHSIRLYCLGKRDIRKRASPNVTKRQRLERENFVPIFLFSTHIPK